MATGVTIRKRNGVVAVAIEKYGPLLNRSNVNISGNNRADIMIWQSNTTLSGTPTSSAIGSFPYGLDVNWGDGTINSWATNGPNPTHTYASGGTYTIRVTGGIASLSDTGARIVDVICWSSITGGNGLPFKGIGYLAFCKDETNLTTVSATNTINPSFAAQLFNSSGVTTIDVSNWELEEVTSMEATFGFCSNFNADTSSWNIGPSLIALNSCFQSCGSFTNANFAGWDVSNVLNFGAFMLGAAGQSTEGLDQWTLNTTNKSTGTNDSVVANALADSTANFSGDGVSNGNTVRNITDGRTAVVTGVTATQLTLDVDIFLGTGKSYEVFAGIDMSNFSSANFADDIGGWDVSHVTNMSNMLNSNNFNSDIGSWDVSAVTNFNQFVNGSSFNNGGVGGVGVGMDTWNVQAATNMTAMFDSASAFNQYIGSWTLNPAGNLSLSAIFRGANAFDQDLSGWDWSKVVNIVHFMRYKSAVSSQYTSGGVSGVGVGMDTWDMSNITNAQEAFLQFRFNVYIGSWDLSSCTNMKSMFSNCFSFNQDIGGWTLNTDPAANVDAASMFIYTPSFTNGGVGGVGAGMDQWDVSRFSSMANFFQFTPFTHTLESWRPGNCTNFNTFCGASQSFNAGAWDIGSATTMTSFMRGATAADADATIRGWESATNTPTGVNAASAFGNVTMSEATYSAAKTAYDNLILAVGSGGYGWNLTNAINWVP